jgi:hypothetical protein
MLCRAFQRRKALCPTKGDTSPEPTPYFMAVYTTFVK